MGTIYLWSYLQLRAGKRRTNWLVFSFTHLETYQPPELWSKFNEFIVNNSGSASHESSSRRTCFLDDIHGFRCLFGDTYPGDTCNTLHRNAVHQHRRRFKAEKAENQSKLGRESSACKEFKLRKFKISVFNVYQINVTIKFIHFALLIEVALGDSFLVNLSNEVDHEILFIIKFS